MKNDKREEQKQRVPYKANYRGATPKQVAQAILKYRPVPDGAALTSKDEQKKARPQLQG